ncbi:MAG: CBS domain-containing protein [Thaumarchaeota archaeon]|nr:CBS domain-containing protein [Nitrososphaerota archaeon]
MLKQRSRHEILVTAEDLMKRPIAMDANATIHNATETILDFDISGLIIESDQVMHLSQKGIAQALLENDKSIKSVLALERTRELTLVDRFAPVSNCADLMLKLRINALGVKDGMGLIGIITKHDLVKYFEQSIVDETKLSEIMSVGSFFVPHTATLYDALYKMLDSGISRLLVKDGSDTPVGIVTYKSFLKTAMYHSNQSPDAVFSQNFGKAYKIGQIMTRQIISVSINTSIAKVAKILVDYRVHGVAVTHKQRIVGFVTEKDITRQLAKMA